MKRNLVYAVLAVLILTLGACAFSEEEVQKRVSATLTAVVPPAPTAPGLAVETAIFDRAVDGDTIDVRFSGGTIERVRLIGIDTPERGDPCYSEATRALALFEGQGLILEKDVSETDRYGRLLRYVYVGELMLNERQVASGWAQVYTYPPDVKYAERFLEAQRAAREGGLGLWGDTCMIEGGGPIPLPTGVGDPIYPGTCTGPDLDCGDFSSHSQAQAFFESCGGPNTDLHKLDEDHDGSVCESLP